MTRDADKVGSSGEPAADSREEPQATLPFYRLGIDAGSKTIKLVLTDEDGAIVHSVYRRHRADILTTLEGILHDVIWSKGDARVVGGVTGSAGMRLAELLGLPYTQEVIATKRAVERFIPQTDVSIELGGEDAKIIYFRDGVEMRMNSTCAGGTGGFLENTAHLLGVHTAELDRLAGGYQTLYPIASRCAVFAAADLRPLLNAGARKSDLAASAMQAVVTQVIAGLAQGRPITGNVAFLGGPLQHMNILALFFERALGLERRRVIRPDDAHLFVARGAALCAGEERTTLQEIQERLSACPRASGEGISHLPPLFANEGEREAFRERHAKSVVPIESIRDYSGTVYVGIDAGSTTVKLVAIDGRGRILYTDYRVSEGKTINVCRKMLRELYHAFPAAYGRPSNVSIGRVCATGYGENLLKTAFKVDMGEVETVAHLRAAQEFQPEVDFVLDIGGQDIKCMRIQRGRVEDIMLNEACSSGCGALIQGFARSLKRSQSLFAEDALNATNPVDLGTRCTVFMTSRVRHAQKEGVPVEDIAAGLAYSVVRNALYKVIGISDPSQLGEHIVVQGGTFMSNAVLRAFELVSGREVVRPSIAHVMGAYGAALLARDSAFAEWGDQADEHRSDILDTAGMDKLHPKQSARRCQGCSNNCLLTINEYLDEAGGEPRRLITGNRCERFVVDDGAIEGPLRGLKEGERPRRNLLAYEQELLKAYEQNGLASAGAPRVGIPRVLEFYRCFPFWSTFFQRLGCRVVDSGPTTTKLWRKGAASVLSESVCFPAKVTHGHVIELLDQGVDCIWMPLQPSSFPYAGEGMRDCQVSTEYPQVLASLFGKQVAFLTPNLRQGIDAPVLAGYLQDIIPGIAAEEVQLALDAALQAQEVFDRNVQDAGRILLEEVESSDSRALVLAGHPYHTDPGLSHGIDELAEKLGFCVFSTRSLAGIKVGEEGPEETEQVATGWTRERELYHAARVACEHPRLDFVHLYSFGCGIDPLAIDSIKGLLLASNSGYTALKVDEMVDLATVRIRLRSLAAAEVGRDPAVQVTGPVLVPDGSPDGSCPGTKDSEQTSVSGGIADVRAFDTLICPHLAPWYADAVAEVLEKRGTRFLQLPEPAQTAFEVGLRYLNNDLCYPTIALIGQLLEHLLFCESLEGLALLAPQLCLGCRSVELRSLLRQALEKAGLPELPIIAYPEFNGGDAFGAGLAEELKQTFVQTDTRLLEEMKSGGIGSKVGIAGSIPLALTPSLNKDIQSQVIQAGFTPVLPPASLLLESDRPLETALEFFAQQGVTDVIALQAFGCLTSHVKGRGAMPELKHRYPGMRVSFVEYDPGTSETNQLNRIQLALAVALDH